MSDEQINFSKKGKRKVTQFIAEELLYDFVVDQLDTERKKAVEEYVRSNPEAQLEIKRIKEATQYADQLSKTSISDILVEKIKEPTHFLDRILRKTGFEEWPLSVKVGFEFLVVSIGVVSVILVIPWHRLMEINFNKNRDIILVEMEKAKRQMPDEIPASPEVKTEVLYPDEDPKKKGTIVVQEEKKDLPSGEKKIPVTQEQPVVEAKPKEAAKENKSEKKQGFLYRGEIYVTNLPVTTKKFVDYITEIGGRKAGEVPIGWTKGNSTYFHFTLPENKYEPLQTFLQEYGEFKAQKLTHDRVMPDGIVRVIMTVYEKK